MIPHVGGDGEDYVSGPFNITIIAGQTNASFHIPVIDDDIYEQTEQFNVNIEHISTLSNVHIGFPYTATVVIADESDCE